MDKGFKSLFLLSHFLKIAKLEICIQAIRLLLEIRWKRSLTYGKYQPSVNQLPQIANETDAGIVQKIKNDSDTSGYG